MASISNVVGTAKLKKTYVPFSDKLTKSLEDVTKTIEENKAILDTIQELGIGLAQAVNVLSASALHYATMVNNILDSIMPFVQNLPFLPKQTQKFLADLNTFADKFLASCQSAQKISSSVESGLQTGNVNALKTHSADLKQVVNTVKSIIPAKK
jgi:hypothetical protein